MKKPIQSIQSLALLLSFVSSVLMTGCTDGFSFGSKSNKDVPVSQPAGSSRSPLDSSSASIDAAPAGDRVWIKRTDGGISCEQDKAQTVEQGEAELKKAGIQVMESQKGNDGKMHIQMCGAPTGSENRYLIPKSDLEKAKALGFQ